MGYRVQAEEGDMCYWGSHGRCEVGSRVEAVVFATGNLTGMGVQWSLW